MIEAFTALRTALAEVVSAQADLLEAVRCQAQPVWESLAAGKADFPRKPSFNLRLFTEDRQTLIGLSPTYARRAHSVDCTQTVLDVIGEVAGYLGEGEARRTYYQLPRRLTLMLAPGAPPRPQCWRKTALDDVTQVLPTLAQFVADPAAVLCRSTMHCAVCGRYLTDGQSRGRGIGPECLKHVGSFLALSQPLWSALAHMPEATP
jgi:hypothetical protein